MEEPTKPKTLGRKKDGTRRHRPQIVKKIAQQHDRDLRIYREYMQGKDQREIAKDVGLSQTRVCEILKRVGQEFTEDVGNEVQIHLGRLHRGLAYAWQQLEKTKKSCWLSEVRKFLADIAKIKGLAAPSQVDISVNHEHSSTITVDAEIADIIAEICNSNPEATIEGAFVEPDETNGPGLPPPAVD